MWGQGEPPTPRNSIGGKEEGGGEKGKKKEEEGGKGMSPYGVGSATACSPRC